MPAIANGNLGTVVGSSMAKIFLLFSQINLNFFTQDVTYAAGVYNGFLNVDSTSITSHR